MAQAHKQNYLNFLVIAFVIIGVLLIFMTLSNGISEQSALTGGVKPLITRAYNSEFLTLSAVTRVPAATTTKAP